MSSDYYGGIGGELADEGAADEAAFLAWLDDWTRKPADGTYHDHLCAAFIAGTAHARNAASGRCCDLHGRNCEPPSELCCELCTEARHCGWTDSRSVRRFGHPDGETCSNPDLSPPCDRCPNAATCAAGGKCLEPRGDLQRGPGARLPVMREIQRLVIDKATGDATLTTGLAGDDADTAERFRQLKAGLPDLTPDAAVMAGVRCDGCGDLAGVDFDNPELPGGWTATPDGDFCPRCGNSD